MENKKNSFKIFSIVLIAVIVGLVAYIIIDKNTHKEVVVCTTKPTDEISFNSYVENIKKSMLKMDKDYSEYETFGIDEGMEDDTIVIPNNNDYVLKDILSVEINYKGEAYVNIMPNTDLYKTYGAKHKLKSGVIDAGIYTIGNGGYSYIYLVNDDGKISYVDSSRIYEENVIEVIQIDKLSNIIKLMQVSQFDAASVIAVDVYGNMYDISE